MDMGRWIYIRRERVCASIEKVKTEWYIYTGWCLFVLFTLFYSLLSFFFFSFSFSFLVLVLIWSEVIMIDGGRIGIKRDPV